MSGGPPEGPFRPVVPEQVGPSEPAPRLWLHALLFLATIATTTFAGLFLFRSFFLGCLYSVAVLTILGVHELGHYFASRRWGVRATLPYFIPFPPNPYVLSFGTMGAVIKIRSPIPNRNALVDIGAAGPIAGFVVAVIALIVGLSLSEVQTLETPGGLIFSPDGESILSSWMISLTLGEFPPGAVISLHPIALAGWLGLFITVLNLLPIGQLDGGHIVYALFGRRHTLIANAATVLLFLLCLAGPPYGWLNVLRVSDLHAGLKVWAMSRWLGWIFFAVLVRAVLGIQHPPPMDAETPLKPSRRVIGYVALAIFVLCFIPVPFGEI
ncbi:site-2 protease family protein [bacterium]|nr:site-2 protease family protein [bacterium]